MRRWRLHLANMLLVTGVYLTASHGWWPLLGGAALMFVPALILDQAVREPRHIDSAASRRRRRP